tara:strand:- start:18081 stop:18944 length:864 start_codon:yes stop_codon:yes gene_type:complete
MLPFIGKGLGLLKTGWAFGGTLLKGGLGLVGLGGAGLVADQALNRGRGTSSFIDGIGGLFGRGMQEATQTEAAAKRDAEVADASSSFQWFFAKLGAFFSLFGDAGKPLADWCMKKVDGMEERAFKIDQDRKAQREVLEYGPQQNIDPATGLAQAPDAKVGFAQAVKAGVYLPNEMNLMDGVHNVSHGLQSMLVHTAAGVASLVSDDSYSDLAKSWNKAVEDTAVGINKPDIDSAAGHALHTAAEYGFGLGLLTKVPKVLGWGGSIASGLLNKGTSAAPVVQKLDLAM